MRFAEQWCKWIMKCITSFTYSVLINGLAIGKITPQRRICQGNPISPYLYLICTEGLSNLIQQEIHAGHLHGFRASRNGPAISHMFFADDSLILCKAQKHECQALLQVLKRYENASGQ